MLQRFVIYKWSLKENLIFSKEFHMPFYFVYYIKIPSESATVQSFMHH